MNNKPFTYEIRNQEIAKELLVLGFNLQGYTPGYGWTIEAPPGMSATKARKIISAIIKLFNIAKELVRAQNKYNNLLNEIDNLIK